MEQAERRELSVERSVTFAKLALQFVGNANLPAFSELPPSRFLPKGDVKVPSKEQEGMLPTLPIQSKPTRGGGERANKEETEKIASQQHQNT